MTPTDRAMHRLTLALAFLAICMWMYACIEATQTTTPSSIDVNIETPAPTTSVGTGNDPTPSPTDCRLELEPPSPLSVEVGKNVNTKVVTFNSSGAEIQTENISVNVANPAIATLTQIDGRFVMFGGESVGQTTAIISTSCAQTSVVINVGPAV